MKFNLGKLIILEISSNECGKNINNRVIKIKTSNNLSITILPRDCVLEIFIALGKTKTLKISPALRGNVLFKAIDPINGAMQSLNLINLSVLDKINDHL